MVAQTDQLVAAHTRDQWGVEQLTRYLELMNRDPLLAPVAGVFAAQQIKPQARTLAQDRGIRCVTVNYDALRGMESDDLLLF
jgi:RecB family endonuclease NucS